MSGDCKIGDVTGNDILSSDEQNEVIELLNPLSEPVAMVSAHPSTANPGGGAVVSLSTLYADAPPARAYSPVNFLESRCPSTEHCQAPYSKLEGVRKHVRHATLSQESLRSESPLRRSDLSTWEKQEKESESNRVSARWNALGAARKLQAAYAQTD
ncbi:hypothetical protein SKAU_G00124430 [Synaphobranchus kaupii]|uniref:Uncharacterized protein n=1 Tax=Synaphobranchus kaupii TaxID=118154 RepID=A0A9Q1FQ44_SYNKA|nr:hypothetical protein SKAU_G00124430 [Synaphobranchus kaupii]